MSHPITGEPSRVLKSCAGCGGVDDHPKHVSAALISPAAPPDWHHDCHAAVGCRLCIAIERQSGGKRGDALIAHKVAMQAPDAPWLVVEHHDGTRTAHHSHPAPTTPHPLEEG